MDEIRKQVSRARRRMSLRLFAMRLAKCWTWAFTAAIVAIGVPKIVAIANLPARWDAAWLAGAAAAGIVMATVWNLLRGPSELEAAVEVDSAFGLKERVASSLSLTSEAATSEAGRALVADAERAVRRIDVAERFRFKLWRGAWLSPTIAAAAILLAIAVDDKSATSVAAPIAPGVTKEQMEQATAALKKRVVEQRKLASERGLKDAEAALRELEKSIETLRDADQIDQKQELVKLNDLRKQVSEQRQKLGGDEGLEEELSNLKDLEPGLADEMVKALGKGDWQQASKEVAALKKQATDGSMTPPEQERVQKQLEQVAEKVRETAAERGAAAQELKRQAAEAQQRGDLAQAGKLQQSLERLAKKQKLDVDVSKLADALADAAKMLSQEDLAKAGKSLEKAMGQLDQLKQMAEGTKMLDQVLAALETAKQSMAQPGKASQSMGNSKQDSQGKNASSQGQTASAQNKAQSGSGMGKGSGDRGKIRVEQDVAPTFDDLHVNQSVRKGASETIGDAEGPTIRGEVQAAVEQEMATSSSTPADPLVIERLPRALRENAEDYFNRLREEK